MSYAFTAKGLCKSEAIIDLDSKVDKFVQDVQLHEEDKGVILQHARGVVAVLEDPYHDEEVVISCHGYTVRGEGERTTSAYCAIAAHIMVKK